MASSGWKPLFQVEGLACRQSLVPGVCQGRTGAGAACLSLGHFFSRETSGTSLLWLVQSVVVVGAAARREQQLRHSGSHQGGDGEGGGGGGGDGDTCQVKPWQASFHLSYVLVFFKHGPHFKKRDFCKLIFRFQSPPPFCNILPPVADERPSPFTPLLFGLVLQGPQFIPEAQILLKRTNGAGGEPCSGGLCSSRQNWTGAVLSSTPPPLQKIA